MRARARAGAGLGWLTGASWIGAGAGHPSDKKNVHACVRVNRYQFSMGERSGSGGGEVWFGGVGAT